jgi:type II secretory pathway pseudopilin PulG
MNGDKGFTYPAALAMIVIISVVWMGVHQQWQTIVQRDREKELLFRGAQIRTAIASYYAASGGRTPQYPDSVPALLKDNRFPVIKRHLRKPYKDPMTPDGEWGIIYTDNGRIKGVYSKNRRKPLKTAAFPPEFSAFENKTTYSDWQFIFTPTKEKGS